MACGAAGRITANGLALGVHRWVQAGRPPALLLHSLAAHSHWWDWTAPYLAERLDVVALDFRGHGDSGHAVPPAYGFDDYAADVVAVLDALGWTAPLLIGHSMGGYVGAVVAAHHPERVGALVIADMLTGFTPEHAQRARTQAARPAQTFPTVEDAAARFRLVPPETNAPAAWLTHLGAAGARERPPGAWQAAFDRQVFLHPPPDPWPFLGDLQSPTLVVRGGRSPVMTADAMARVAAAVTRGEAVEIPGAYHHLVLDAPDAFAAIVLGWLDRVTGRARC